MKLRLSAKGQVLLTSPLRKKMDLRPGDQLEVRVEGDRSMLIPRRIRMKKSRIVNDPITGLPVLSTALGAPTLASTEVKEILAKI